jgi:hypothetical protein
VHSLIPDFHLIGLELGSEQQTLERALVALDAVDAGETVFFSEYLAWTARGSGRAFATLIAQAQQRNINIVTTLNLGPDLHPDLPGSDTSARYNGLTIFTRFGFAHVPQAKLSPHSFEAGIDPYRRINRVRLDWQEELLDVRFIIDSDLMLFAHLAPRDIRCDLLVVLARLPSGSEKTAARLLGRALSAGVARTALLVNPQGSHTVKTEDVIDATSDARVDDWPSPRAIRAAFHLYEPELVPDHAALSALPRRARIPVMRPAWKTQITHGAYPVTISL